MHTIRLALVQTNPTVGAIEANLADIFSRVQTAVEQGANLVLCAEMSVTGYPIEDLAQRPGFLKAVEDAVDQFAGKLDKAGLGEIYVVVGHPASASEPNGWAIAQNCASVIHRGSVSGRYAKHHLPNYSVFDEYRVFVPGNEPLVFELDGKRCGVLICEDIWQSGGPVAALAEQDLDLALVLNGSPFELGKRQTRRDLVSNLAITLAAPVAYVNLVGGQDDLVFDGSSLLTDATGKVVFEAVAFEPSVDVFEVSNGVVITERQHQAPPTADQDLAQVWDALTVGLRDYVNKNGFASVILGLSGGIDSAVCASLAVDAIGPERVFGVSLPSKYSSDHSKSDAFDLAERLGIQIRTEVIEPMVEVTEIQLGLSGVAAENLQARVRGLILMSLSNSEGHLTLTTGNKTELAVGYSTIYGDSVGGFAPIKDVAKTMVWELARYRNALTPSNPPIPENSISKPPSAELRPGQLDQDSLPEYDVLDAILELYLDKRLGQTEILKAGFDPVEVSRVLGLVDRAEWKRRQGAIGPKITGMAFGRDRRMPITNAYHS